MATQDDSSRDKKSEADAYDKLMDEFKNCQIPNILNKVHLLKGYKVLDLGCGTGNHAYMLAERVGPTGSVIGVDPDKERIKIAREKWTRDNLTFIEGDDQTYPEDHYDLIFSHYVLHWIKNKQQTFERAYKNLRPGGEFAFVTVHRDSRIAEELFDLMGPEGHEIPHNLWHYITTEEYKELFTAVGFKVTSIEEGFDDYTFPNVDVLLTSWHGITDGRFDISRVNQTVLEKFKEKYASTTIPYNLPVIRVTLVKP